MYVGGFQINLEGIGFVKFHLKLKRVDTETWDLKLLNQRFVKTDNFKSTFWTAFRTQFPNFQLKSVSKKPPLIAAGNPNLCSDEIPKGKKKVLYFIAKTYDLSNMKRLKQLAYRDILMRQQYLGSISHSSLYVPKNSGIHDMSILL